MKTLLTLTLILCSLTGLSMEMINRNAYGVRGTSPYWTDPNAASMVFRLDFENTSGTNAYAIVPVGGVFGARGGASGRYVVAGTNAFGRVNYAMVSAGGGETISTLVKPNAAYTVVYWEKGILPTSQPYTYHWDWAVDGTKCDYQCHQNSLVNVGIGSVATVTHADHTNKWCLIAAIVMPNSVCTNIVITETGYSRINTQQSGYAMGTGNVKFRIGLEVSGAYGNSFSMFDRFAVYTNKTLSSNELINIYNNTHPTNNFEWPR